MWFLPAGIVSAPSSLQDGVHMVAKFDLRYSAARYAVNNHYGMASHAHNHSPCCFSLCYCCCRRHYHESPLTQTTAKAHLPCVDPSALNSISGSSATNLQLSSCLAAAEAEQRRHRRMISTPPAKHRCVKTSLQLVYHEQPLPCSAASAVCCSSRNQRKAHA
jgi:hypothetical protein